MSKTDSVTSDDTIKRSVPEQTFEELLGELTLVVERLEKGNLPLEESLTLFSRGVVLQNSAKAILAKASARLDVLLATADGTEKRPVDPSEFF